MSIGWPKRIIEWVASLLRDGHPPFRSASGEVITEKMAARMADEAEAGYELDQFTGIRPGPGRASL